MTGDDIHLVDAYEDRRGEPALWRLLVERANEDDPFMPRALRMLPKRSMHKAIVKSRPHQHWFLIMDRRACVGAILVSKRNMVGIVLFQRYRSMGYGRRALELLLVEVEPLPGVNGGRFGAQIHPQNFRSAKLFEKFGFKHVGNLYELP